MTDTHAAALIAVSAGVTALLRFLPFLLLGGKRKTPEFITYLGKVLPYAIMGMLVVYCLRGITPLVWPHGIPELLAAAVTALLHVWRRNTLVSIAGGTICYMVLIQFLFV